VAVVDIDVVLLHEELYALHGLVYYIVFPLDHLRHIDAYLTGFDAVLRKFVGSGVVVLGAVKKGFRGDTANVEAGTAQAVVVFFNDGRF